MFAVAVNMMNSDPRDQQPDHQDHKEEDDGVPEGRRFPAHVQEAEYMHQHLQNRRAGEGKNLLERCEPMFHHQAKGNQGEQHRQGEAERVGAIAAVAEFAVRIVALVAHRTLLR